MAEPGFESKLSDSSALILAPNYMISLIFKMGMIPFISQVLGKDERRQYTWKNFIV